ncbi:MAG: hypothetical protein SFW65_01615 [Alphaproteobacteria bacterium]|nr:hypothetical protein [Alphaproteobacteria bacterium]
MLRFIFVFALILLEAAPALAASSSPLPTIASPTLAAPAPKAVAPAPAPAATKPQPAPVKDNPPAAVSKIESAPAASDGSGEVSEDDPYTVHGVKVDVSESTSMKARDKAFTLGQQTAFIALAKSLSGDEPLKVYDEATIGKLIKSFEVESERASGTRYTATLTYHFKPQATAALLGKGGAEVNDDPYNRPKKPDGIQALSATTMPPMRILVLPILRAPDRSILWEEKTPWHLAWYNVLSDKPTPDLILPDGTVEDVGAITSSEALAGLNLPLTRIMRKYQARGAIVPVLLANNTMPQANQSLSVQLARFDERGKMISTIVLPVPAQPNRKDMEWLQASVTNSIAAWRDSVSKTQPVMPQYGVAQPAMPTNTTPSQFLRVTLTVPFANMEEWSAKREALQAIPGMAALEVLRMNRYRAVVQIDYTGAQSQLDQALSTRNMQIMPTNPPDGTYMLSSTAQPQVINGTPGQPVFTTVYPNAQPQQMQPTQQPYPQGYQPAYNPDYQQQQMDAGPASGQDPNIQDRFEQQ